MVRETPQDPPRRPSIQVHASPACGCPCTSATRCRSNVQFHAADDARPKRSSCSRDAPGVRLVDGGDGSPDPARGRGHRPGARRPPARGPVAGRTRSTSGSPATTCARAPRSTASRWPSSCSTPRRQFELGSPSSPVGRAVARLALLVAVEAHEARHQRHEEDLADDGFERHEHAPGARARGEVAVPDRGDGDEREVEEVDVVRHDLLGEEAGAARLR